MTAKKTALIIVDMINDFSFKQGKSLAQNTEKIIKPIMNLREFSYTKEWPVIFVNDSYQCPVKNYESIKKKCLNPLSRHIIDAFPLKTTDLFIPKSQFSTFFQTNLDKELSKNKVQRLIITGIAGHICVLFSACDAYMRNYELVTPVDAFACMTDQQKFFSIEMFMHVLHSDLTPSIDFIKKEEEKN